jgi:hypothetical protein
MLPLLDEISPLPAYSALLGLCDDDLPLLLDLTEPDSGSVLLLGDSAGANRLHLKAILHSVFELNTMEEVNIHMISNASRSFAELHAQEHMKVSLEPDMAAAVELVEELANLAELRRVGRSIDPIQVLAIDEIDNLMRHLDAEHKRLLHWLIEFGPQAGVWVIATLDNAHNTNMLRAMNEAFGTLVLGCSVDARGLRHAMRQPEQLAALALGAQAIVPTAERDFRIWIPSLEEDRQTFLDLGRAAQK